MTSALILAGISQVSCAEAEGPAAPAGEITLADPPSNRDAGEIGRGRAVDTTSRTIGCSRPGPSVPDGPVGWLTLATTPWTHVHVAGSCYGNTPLLRAPVPGGRHALQMTNEVSDIDEVRQAAIELDEVTRLRFDFTAQ